MFSALDLQSGRSVAIKQVRVFDMDQSELQSIEVSDPTADFRIHFIQNAQSEISLLRKLNHENIVKYFTTIKTDDHLFIVLEYMENGSLAQLMKKFGTLSETLVAMYISQVLKGLCYLHEQGVLHRDIKGANILTTKDGLVVRFWSLTARRSNFIPLLQKLADFGVALQTGEAQKANSVVGTPYWSTKCSSKQMLLKSNQVS